MANFVRSFSQGFDVGNKVIDTMDRRERQKALDERNQTLQDREDTQWEQGQEQYNHGLERRGIEENQADEAHNLGVKQTKQAMSLANTAEKRAQNQENRAAGTYSYDKKIKTRQQDAAIFEDQLKRAQATQDYSWFNGDDAQELFSRNPQYNPQWITSDDVYQSSGRLINTLNGAANGQLPQWNDPDMLEDINNVFPEIANSTDLPQYTQDGKKIVGRKVTGIVPVEGGKVAIQMDVTDEDGKTYSAPLTQSRTHDESDNVAVMGVNELSNRLNLINQGREDSIFQDTARYMTLSSGKSGKSNKPTLQKEQYAAENKIADDYRKQIAELDSNPAYMDDPEGKRARKLELEQSRDQEMAQVRLRASNILGETGSVINLEGQQREKALTQTMDLFKQAFPQIEFTPELDANIRTAINQGKDEEWISEYIADYANSQTRSNPSQSQGDQSSSILKDIVGTPETTSTGGQTTSGGKFYQAGNDIGKPNVVNQEQAKMTPYQAKQGNGLANYQPYGS